MKRSAWAAWASVLMLGASFSVEQLWAQGFFEENSTVLLREAQDALARGDQSEAGYLYYAARDLAWKAEDWRTVTEAGYAFVLLGEPDEALRSWWVARDIATVRDDADGLAAAGLGFASVGEFKEAYLVLADAVDLAGKEGQWRSLLAAGRALVAIGADSDAVDAAQEAAVIATKEDSIEGLLGASGLSARAGDLGAARRLAFLAGELIGADDPWQEFLLAGYAFETVGSQHLAVDMVYRGLERAEVSDDWLGVIAAARTLGRLGYEVEGEELFARAENLADAAGAYDAFAATPRAFVETLVLQTGSTIRPGLALSWEIDESGVGLKLALRPDVRCFNGDLLTADSVVASLESAGLGGVVMRIADHEILIAPSQFLPVLSDPAAAVRCQ